MRAAKRFFNFLCSATFVVAAALPNTADQLPLLQHAHNNRSVSPALFAELEEFARLADISYCIGMTGIGIGQPFTCLSRCSDFPDFELATTWNTGPLMSDSCGYIALDHGKKRVVVAFRGTYSVANTIVDLSTVPQEYVPYSGSGDEDELTLPDVSHHIMKGVGKRSTTDEPGCDNCTVHMGFHTSWKIARVKILPELQKASILHPDYQVSLVGHSLGGAVAALAGLDLHAHGFEPTVTTFGEPRVGNTGFNQYLDARFGLTVKKEHGSEDDTKMRYRRVTHVDDPVPLLPLSEWAYSMHAGEIYIIKPSLSPDVPDLRHCEGDDDKNCIAGQDATVESDTTGVEPAIKKRQLDLLSSVKDEIDGMHVESWGVPSRYKLWQLFFAHRDYFWRIGLCVPGGDPLGGGRKYEFAGESKDDL